MKFIPELMTEALNTIAAHYAEKIVQRNAEATKEEIGEAVKAAWEQITNEAAALYKVTYAELQKVA